MIRHSISGIYLTIVMALTSMSVIMTVFVLNLHHRGPNKRPVPKWLRHVFLGRMSRYLCLQDNPRDPGGRYYENEERFIKNVSLKITLDNIQQALKNESQLGSNEPTPRGGGVNLVDTGGHASASQNESASVTGVTGVTVCQGKTGNVPLCNHVDSCPNDCNRNSSVPQTQHYYQYNPQTRQYSATSEQNSLYNSKPENVHASAVHPKVRQIAQNSNNKTKKRSTALSKTNEEILNSLKRILEKHEKEDREYDVIQDWRRVAQCVDRILFFIFLAATTMSTVGLLVLAPASQHW